ncbi:hypothetical protein HYH03_014765 [Edaphochlamys debaryana]|uniref:Uncharacterized protein n=1 Tax=Edaphochlamys debaryana TaxID=47281 RepID=A0A836BRN0_9CHLO|nr:hypothetical protein HYH03_014765 [Edaphochlamys debaryana]|eukprot:KAG2486596.1 hypothetical protein HYH03_014765 [Edaphochlamys debaryana]
MAFFSLGRCDGVRAARGSGAAAEQGRRATTLVSRTVGGLTLASGRTVDVAAAAATRGSAARHPTRHAGWAAPFPRGPASIVAHAASFDAADGPNRGPGEAPLFPATDMPSDPALAAAFDRARSWQQLRELFASSGRRMDPALVLQLTTRLAELTGALPGDGTAPAPLRLEEAEARDVAALASGVCRASQPFMADSYGLRQVAQLSQAFVSLGSAPPTPWFKAAEVVALRTQREGEAGRGASREMVTELLGLAGDMQRCGHGPDRAFTGLLADVAPYEEVPPPPGSEAEERQPLFIVPEAGQLMVLARAVLLWGLEPGESWPEGYLQACYFRIARANELWARSAAGGPAGVLSTGEAAEAADAEASLTVGGLATLLWASAAMGARPADPEGKWMGELRAAAERRLRAALAAPLPTPVAAAPGVDAGADEVASGTSLQDVASLLSAMHQIMYDPGAAWVGTCLQATASMQSRTDLAVAAEACAAGGAPPPGDALAAVLFLAAQYDHPQDAATREAVVAVAAGALEWMGVQGRLEAQTAAAAAAARVPALADAPPLVFSGRGLTQLIMALVRMGGQPSEEWVAAWAAAAQPLTEAATRADGEGGGVGPGARNGFDLDQVMAVMATAYETEVELPQELQESLVGAVLVPYGRSGQPSAAANGQPTAVGVSGPGAFLPRGAEGAAGQGGGAEEGIRTLGQFRELLELVALLLPDAGVRLRGAWAEPFARLVEDFRLRLGRRDLVSVLSALTTFRNLVAADLTPLTSPGGGQAASTSGPAPGPAPPPSNRSTSAGSGSGSKSGSGSGRRGPIVIRAPAPPGPLRLGGSKAAAEKEEEEEGRPMLLDEGWLGGLLADLKARGGPEGPTDLMRIGRTLTELQAPAPLLSYLEGFSVDMTGEDGMPKRRAAAAAPKAAAAAATATAAAGGEGDGAAAGAKPGAAKLKLKLQQGALGAAAARAPASAASATAALAGAAEAEAEAAPSPEEAEEWGQAWQALLGTFSGAGHVPGKSWWSRFSACTLPQLSPETMQGPRLAALAAAALSLSERAAKAGPAGPQAGPAGAPAGLGEELILPNVEWHQQAFSALAEYLGACPLNMEHVREQALAYLEAERQAESPSPSSTPSSIPSPSPSSTPSSAPSSTPSDPSDASTSPSTPDAPSPFTGAQLQAACQLVASQLPGTIARLAEARVALPPAVCEMLEDLGAEAVRQAAGALQAADEIFAGRQGRGAEGGSEEEAGVEVDGIAYAQQILGVVMQVFLSSDYAPSQEWFESAASVMLWGAPVFEQTGARGQLEERTRLLLGAGPMSTLAYLAGKTGLELSGEQAKLILQHACRLASESQGEGEEELGPGELAALLSGLGGSADLAAADCEAELRTLVEHLASQGDRLSAQGLAETAAALLRLGAELGEEAAVRFRPSLARELPRLEPAQLLAVLAAGPSLGLEPPPRDLLTALAKQAARMAADPDPLGTAAATEAAAAVMRWAPSAPGGEAAALTERVAEALEALLPRLHEVPPPVAARLSFLMAAADVQPPGRSQEELDAALAPLVSAVQEGLPDYDLEQLGYGIAGLSTLGARLGSSWLVEFTEALRPHLGPGAAGRSLAHVLSGLGTQGAALDGPASAAFWAAARRAAAPPQRDLDAEAACLLLRGANELGQRPDSELMRALLDSVLLRYREEPNAPALAQLVQLVTALGYVPNPGWAAEAQAALAASLNALSPEQRAEAVRMLQQEQGRP